MDIIEDRNIPSAVCVFKDREEPRKAFWNEFTEAETACREKKKKAFVLSYYGMGGIGKTSLCRKLQKEMQEKSPNALYIAWDFNEAQDCRTVLCRLKNQLEKKGFRFPLFDYACYFYACKIGENPSSPEVKKLIENSSVLRLCSQIAGLIPGVGFWVNLIKMLDETFAWVREYMNNHTASAKEIENTIAGELYEKLPLFFAKDLAANMENQDTPLVIFLDTYEKLVNELSSANSLSQDLWLRGNMGVIRRVPYVLWVITGREKLQWHKEDSAWEGVLKQHLLGNLSEKDSLEVLFEAGISDEALQKSLYQLTDGVPIYLDICIAQYLQILYSGIAPKKEDFGIATDARHTDCNATVLMEKFLDHIKDSIQKDMLYMFACVEWWNDDSIIKIATNGHCNFSDSAYEAIKKLSFVIQDSHGFRLHRTVREILLQLCPKGIKEKVAKGLLGVYDSQQLIQESILSPSVDEALRRMVQAGLLLHNDDEALQMYYQEKLYENLLRLTEQGQSRRAFIIATPLLFRAEKNKDSLFYAEVQCDTSWMLAVSQVFEQAASASETNAPCFSNIVHDVYMEILSGMTYMAWDYMSEKEYQKAIPLQKTVLARCQKLLGDSDTKTLAAMEHLARSLQHMGDFEAARLLHERIVAQATCGFGKDHPRTIVAIGVLADVLFLMELYEDACRLQETVATYFTHRLGKENEGTIDEIKKWITYLEKADAASHAERIRMLRETYGIIS
ncbi:MAG: tetratricopeptide repeat protein [Clostridia bacterium]|nr:tetratricopeptide repeat protein [Clostridia bacterium]